jgi:formylglycine-generating enzyme
MKKLYAVLILIFVFSISLICLAVEKADPKEAEKPIEVKEAKEEKEQVITNSIAMKLRLIEPGEFMMGSDKGGEWDKQEKPAHKVKITKAFYIGVYEVTQEQYEKIMGKNPSSFKGAKLPVDSVGWKEAQEFCKKLSEKENAEYFLPTEAQWEYACRAGSKTEYYWGDKMDNEFCWYTGTSGKKTHDVGTKKSNDFGLYDMSGNVYEICSDWYDENYYKTSPEEDPKGPEKGTGKVIRGGCWAARETYCRSASRVGISERAEMDRIGFRVCRAVSEQK